ncbi:MAG: carbon-nitrogen hydrolase family protein, partial [Sedimentisphaerales bacterium]|nr:carbon-nitrogen hydrolase family protein [Sedimentisphaerales bacterium]
MNLNNQISRRTLLAASSVGLAATILKAPAQAHAQDKPVPVKRANRLPREVWAATVSLERLEVNTPEEMIRRIIARMEEILPYEPDIICLPEVFPYMMLSKRPPLSECAENPPGPVTSIFAAFAKKNNCYIICPIYTKEDDKFYNAAVVIDRQGQVIGQYRKIRPTVGEIEKGITPGPQKPPVFDTDLGRIGIQICFDVNWYEGWRHLSDAGAEIVFWPSAFVGGRMLNALAWMNKYHIVTGTRWDPTRIIDITGDNIAVSGHFQHWACGPINLEKVFIHLWPYVRVFPDIRAKYGRKV